MLAGTHVSFAFWLDGTTGIVLANSTDCNFPLGANNNKCIALLNPEKGASCAENAIIKGKRRCVGFI